MKAFELVPPDLSISLPLTHTKLEYAGVSHAAKNTPSNFLETARLPTGAVVLAIGDTGIPDPLPLLCARHYLRGSVSLGRQEPKVFARDINGFIYDCCSAQCSLSCFFAQYDPATGVLRYVNAGHESPLLIRTNPDRAFRLDKGGPVLGLRESSQYSEGAVQLKPGDRLVAFTGGIIDSLAALGSGVPKVIWSP